MSRRKPRALPPLIPEEDEDSEYVVDEDDDDDTASDDDDRHDTKMSSSASAKPGKGSSKKTKASAAPRRGHQGGASSSADTSMTDASRSGRPRQAKREPVPAASSKRNVDDQNDDHEDVSVNVMGVVSEFRDMFGDNDEDVNAWIEQLEAIERQRAQAQDTDNDPVSCVPDFKADELLQKLEALPVAASRIQLFGNGVTDDQLVELTKQRAVELPLFKTDYECALLRESGTSLYVPTNKMVAFPPCCNGSECVATLLPLQVLQPMSSDAKSSSGSATAGADDDHVPTKPLVLTQILYPDEFDALTRNGSVHVESRPCVLCMRYALYDFVLCLRSNRRDEHFGSIPDPNHIRVYQLYRSLVDEPGGYRSDQVVTPDAVNWEGFADPFVCYRYTLLRAVFDTRSSCWFVDQRPLLYDTPVVATPRIGETVAHFRKRGIASMHAQVPSTTQATSRELNATRIVVLLEEHGLASLQRHLAMSRHQSAASPPVTPTRLVAHGQQHVRRLATFRRSDSSTSSHARADQRNTESIAGDVVLEEPMALATLATRLQAIRQAYSRRRRCAPQSPGTGSYAVPAEGEPDFSRPLMTNVHDLVAIDLFIAFVLQVDYRRALYYPSTVANIAPYLQEAALFRNSRARVDAVVHFINKCLPQRCQCRTSNSNFRDFFSECLGHWQSGNALQTARSWVVVQWITVSVLGNWTLGSRTRSLLSTASRKLWLKTVIQRPQAMLRFLADFPEFAVCALQEYVARSILADHALAAHLSEQLDLLEYADACAAVADRSRIVLDRVLEPALAMDAGSPEYVALQERTAFEMRTTGTGKVTEYAYYRERRSAWQILCSHSAVLKVVTQAAHAHGVDAQRFADLLGESDGAIGASDSAFLDPIVSKKAAAVIRRSMYHFGHEEYTAHTSVDVPAKFMQLAVLLCDCEGLRALTRFASVAERAESEKMGERRIKALLLPAVRAYPRTAVVLVWLFRVYAFYASGYSVLLRPHHLRAQAKAIARARDANGNASAHSREIERPASAATTADEIKARTASKSVEIALDDVLLQRCRSCTLVCTLLQRLRKLYKWSYDHGWRNVHIDVTSMRVVCKNYQNPNYPYCAEIEPARAVLLGRFFRWKQSVYTLCSAPGCGSAMEWDPRACLYHKGVYYCRACTISYYQRFSETRIAAQCEYAEHDCVYCGRSLLGCPATFVAFAPYNRFMCATHMGTNAISNFMLLDRWQDPLQLPFFAHTLAQTKRELKRARSERMKSQIDRALAHSRQKTSGHNKR